MKYNVLLNFLRFLVQIKRFFWWLGPALILLMGRFLTPILRFLGFFVYKISYFLKKIGLGSFSELFLKRDSLQFFIFVILLFLVIPQTKIFAQKNNYFPGQKTIAYNLGPQEENYGVEQIVSQDVITPQNTPIWKQGSLVSELNNGDSGVVSWKDQDMAGILAGGAAVGRPIIMPGAAIGGKRQEMLEYIIQPGDSLSGIAYEFGISVQTILWENNITERTTLRLGSKLRIPPTSGVMYTIKKGDTLKKIATNFGAKTEDIVSFNKLKEDGTDLVIGEKIMIPGGVLKVASATTKPSSKANTTGSSQYYATPAGSKQTPGASGFVWPSGVKYITQYFGWKHYGLDVAGPMNTPNYAAKAGTVEISQCGWNSGYGCYVVINHGGGVKTLYGHNNKLLVSPGDYVEAGQTIGLMGNTGNVRGITGIHLHFEVQINGVKVNPLGYIR